MRHGGYTSEDGRRSWAVPAYTLSVAQWADGFAPQRKVALGGGQSVATVAGTESCSGSGCTRSAPTGSIPYTPYVQVYVYVRIGVVCVREQAAR
jgi:hypothetical protein